mgnify:CR=1 FL=1
MAKAFSVASWNVEHFTSQGTRSRVATVVRFILDQEADVIAIYEVEGADVWRALMERMPGYSFFITEGQNTQQILLGVRGDLTAFVTQKVEFRSRDAYMRPGAILTIKHKDTYYPLLFLHVASMTDPRGFGLRSDMVDRAFKFKGDLDKAAGGRSNFIFLGDLNAMGLDYVYGKEEPPGRKLLRAQATAAQGTAGDLGDPAGPGQPEGQGARDQQLDGDAGEQQAAVHRAAEGHPGRGPLDQLLDQVDGDLEQGQASGQAPERLAGRPVPGAQPGVEAAGQGGPERPQTEHDGGGDRRRPVGVAAAGQHGQAPARLGDGQGVGEPVPDHRPGDRRPGQRQPAGQSTQVHRQSIRGPNRVGSAP